MITLHSAYQAARRLYRVRWTTKGWRVLYYSASADVWQAIELPMPKLDAQRMRARLVALSGLFMLGAKANRKVTKAIYRHAPAAAYDILRRAAIDLGLYQPRKRTK